jgi:formylglycine-generating enzyme required for sulfatase activity
MVTTRNSLPAPARFLEPDLIVIPSGEFLMGCETGQENERPVHRVGVDAYGLAKRQVSNAEYELFLNATGSAAPPCWTDADFNDPEQPVVAVSWFEAAGYCAWLSSVSGHRYRLPREAEWEYAARGALASKLFPWGDEPPQTRAGYADRWRKGPEPVGRSSPNTFGLYEMCENVHEWCSDWFDTGYYAHSPDRNPRGPDTGTRKASRGGSWRHHIKISRCAARSSIPPEFQYADYGFRVACDVHGDAKNL